MQVYFVEPHKMVILLPQWKQKAVIYKWTSFKNTSATKKARLLSYAFSLSLNKIIILFKSNPIACVSHWKSYQYAVSLVLK